MVLSGELQLIINGREVVIQKNEAIRFRADVPHEYYPDENVWDIHWVVPEGTALPALLDHFLLKEAGVYKLL